MPYNFPDMSGRSKLEWHSFRLIRPPNRTYRCPATDKLKTEHSSRADVEEWCCLHLKGPWAEVRPLGSDYHAFRMRDASDALLFKLTWGHEVKKFS